MTEQNPPRRRAPKKSRAALLLAANDRLSHAPEQPQGMPDALYQSGSLGAASSDIARFNWMRPDILIDGVSLNELQEQRSMGAGGAYEEDEELFE